MSKQDSKNFEMIVLTRAGLKAPPAPAASALPLLITGEFSILIDFQALKFY